jgi:hypothetical protein
MAEVEQEKRLRLKAEQRASGLKSANQRLRQNLPKDIGENVDPAPLANGQVHRAAAIEQDDGERIRRDAHGLSVAGGTNSGCSFTWNR